MLVRPVLRRLLLAFAACVALSAAEAAPLRLGPLAVAAGPWMQMDARGIISVSVRLVAPVEAAALRAVRPYIGKAALPVEATARVIPATGGPSAGQVIATWELPPFTSGDVRLGAEAASPTVHVPVPADSDDPVRIVIVGGRGWPTADEMTALGPAPAVALVLGTVAPLRVGTGGWEAAIPLVLRLDPGRHDEIGGAVLGDGDPDGADLAVGCLGMPSTRRGPDAAIDCAARPRLWNVLIDPEAGWDIGLQASVDQADPRRLRTPLGIARLLSVPLILAGGRGASFVSEPLSTDAAGMLIAAAGGVRYVSATPSGEGPRGIGPYVATAIDTPGTAVLDAQPDGLRLRLGAIDLAWSPDPQLPSTGAGRIDVIPAVEAWRKDGTLAPQLVWAPRPALAAGEWSVLELFTIAAPDGGAEPTAEARALARRLVADPSFIGDEAALLQRLPIWLRRDALLRWMAEPPSGEQGWIAVAAATDDRELVLALLANVERGRDEALRDVLVRRLAAQAAGRIPVDDDPLLQSRLTSAVFDAPSLSPTPLRPIARDLLGKLAPLGAGPVKRFLDRVGTYRPAE